MCSSNDKQVLDSIFDPYLICENNSEKSDQSSENVKSLTEEYNVSLKWQMDGIKAANNSDIASALKCFDTAINLAPNRADGYNNRAQAHRLNGNTKDAINDLDVAITLCEGCGHVASQAYCQRALIHLYEGRDDEAKHDFELASNLGHKYAKSMLVQLNPYAALCNKMLKQMFSGLRAETKSSN